MVVKKSCVTACPVEWPDGRGISGRMRVEWVAGSPWNRWSDAHGMGGQMTVESALGRKTQDPNDRRIRALYGDVFDLGEDLDVPVLIMPGVEGYGLSRNFGKTLPEIADGADDLIAQLREQSLTLDREGKGKDARRCMVLVEVVAIAKEASTWIKQLHGKFDELRGADQEAA